MNVLFLEADAVPDAQIGYSVIVARFQAQWLFCRHRERTSWEVPGGHREQGETLDETAARELFEETGALDFTLRPIGLYNVRRDGADSFGALYFAEVTRLGPLPDTEIAEVACWADQPAQLTYPAIQPHLFRRVQQELERESAAAQSI